MGKAEYLFFPVCYGHLLMMGPIQVLVSGHGLTDGSNLVHLDSLGVKEVDVDG